MTRLPALLAATALAAALPSPSAAQEIQNGDDAAIDVFFLGNSYIYYNNLPRLLEGISEGLDGPIIRTGQHTHGGFTLDRHLSDGHVPAVLQSPASDGAPWEHVVLQEQSRLGVPYADSLLGTLGDFGPFHAAAHRVGELVRDAGSAPVFYMTWAKERFPNQTDGLASAYDEIGASMNAAVAPVGLAWATVREERPDIDLFIEDGSHPTPAGSYLAACVFYAELTGLDPAGAPSTISGLALVTPGRVASDQVVTLVDLDPGVATYLQSVAWAIVQSR